MSTIKHLHLENKIQSPVYNCTDWKYGFSTAIPTYGEPSKLAFYITKYITKDIKKIFGSYYWSSRSLTRNPDIILTNKMFTKIDLPCFNVPRTNINLKYENNIIYTKGQKTTPQDDNI